MRDMAGTKNISPMMVKTAPLVLPWYSCPTPRIPKNPSMMSNAKATLVSGFLGRTEASLSPLGFSSGIFL